MGICATGSFGKIDDYIGLAESPGSIRPSPTELLMCTASNAALSSSCLQRQVGAVLTNDEFQVLSVGFNEVPPSEYGCQDQHGQCYRKRVRTERTFTCPSCKHISSELACPECGENFPKKALAGKELDLCRALHAEENAILQMAKHGGSISAGTKLYTTTFPCLLCAKKIASLGIDEITYVDPYPFKQAKVFLRNADVKMIPFEGVRAKAFQRLFRKPKD